MNPFDYIKSFSSKTNNVWDEVNGAGYTPFVINRGLSFMQDTIHFANMMNIWRDLDVKAQHDFYYHGIPKGKRFGKWEKKEELTDDVHIVSDYFNINNRMAEQYLKMLTSDQLKIIRDKMNKGGKGNGK